MGDIDNKPDKELRSQKPLDACSALLQEVDADWVAQKKCDSYLAGHQGTVGGAIGRFGSAVDNDAVWPGVGRAVDGVLNHCQLNFERKDNYKDVGLDKKDFDKKLDFDAKRIDKKLIKESLDFAPIPLLAPSVAGFMERVDRNRDGNMTIREINSALNGDDLNKKEKYLLNVLKENRKSIDNDKKGISLADMKEFDSKIMQYQKELTLARKYVPELAELSRELHQRGKLIDDNRDGKFSKEELTSFYIECKKEFLSNPTAQGKRELSALNWGVNNFDRYSAMNGRQGGGQISLDLLQTQMLREMDREISPGLRQHLLSPKDRLRVERYQNSR